MTIGRVTKKLGARSLKSRHRNVYSHTQQVQTNVGDARGKTFAFCGVGQALSMFTKVLQTAVFHDGKTIVTERTIESGTSGTCGD